MQAGRFFRVNDSCNPFDKQRKHMIGSKTGVVLISLCLLFTAGLGWATEYISSDSSFPRAYFGQGFISTSYDSKCFNLTSTGLQHAVHHLNSSQGGTVYVNGNLSVTHTFFGGINGYPVVIDFQNNKVHIQSSFHVFNMTRYLSIRNAFIDIKSGVTFSHAVFFFYSPLTIAHPGVPSISNVMMDGDTTTIGHSNGTGIYLKADATGKSIVGTRIEDVKIRYFEYALRLESNDASSAVNANMFSDIWIAYCRYGVYMENTAGAVDGNVFTNTHIQCNANTRECVTFDGDRNSYQGIIWDASLIPDSTKAVVFKTDSYKNILDCNIFSQGYWMTDNSTDYRPNFINGQGYMPIYGSDDNLTLYLPFSGNRSIAPDGLTGYDRGPYANDVTFTNCNWTTGIAGTALDINQDRDYATGADTLANWDGAEYSPEVTVSCWFNLSSNVDGKNIILSTSSSYSAGIFLQIEDGDIYFVFNPSGTKYTIANTAYDFQKDVWHFIACSLDSTGTPTGLVMLDDYVISTTVDSGGAGTGYTELAVGRRAGNNDGWFNGSIDELRIYDRALSYEELRAQYLGGFQSNGYIQTDDFTVLDSDWHPYLKFPTTNTSTLLIAGQTWYDVTTHKLMVYEGAGVWKSTTFT